MDKGVKINLKKRKILRNVTQKQSPGEGAYKKDVLKLVTLY